MWAPADNPAQAYEELKALQRRMADARARDWPRLKWRQQVPVANRFNELSASAYGRTPRGVGMLDRARTLRGYMQG